MALFYFDTSYNDEVFADGIGMDLPDLAEARRQAQWLISDMSHDRGVDEGILGIACAVLNAERSMLYRVTMRFEGLAFGASADRGGQRPP